MTERLNGGFQKFSLVVRTAGPIGILALGIYYIQVVYGPHTPRTLSENQVKLTEIQGVTANNQAQIIANQETIITLLRDLNRIALRQSITLDNVQESQQYLLRHERDR